MGQAYFQSCCGVKNQIDPAIPFVNEDGDEPSRKFAKSVKQFIEISPKIKQVFVKQRTPHISQRKGVKLNWYYLFAYAAYYDGEWKKGLPHGFGRLVYDDGSIYEGCFHEGTAECRSALFIRQNGTFYKGEVKRNKAEGVGAFTSEKLMYKGQWHNDLPHGEGQEIYSRISHFDGTFSQGKKEGFGRYQWSLTQYYEGQFQQNKIHGFGKHITKQYDYEGQFENGLKSKHGFLRNKLKKWEYDGQFKNNKMHGRGVYKWQDGTIFDGEFQQNEKKRGKLIMANGTVIEEIKE